MIKSVNLSLSMNCGAKCIYCPTNRGNKTNIKTMKIGIAKQIIDTLKNDGFLNIEKIERFELGENGDAFLNKESLDIIRYVRIKFPWVLNEIYTNFQNLDEEKIKIIVDEMLIDSIYCNIDGFGSNYFRVKNIDFRNTIKNIIFLLKYRNSKKSNLRLNIKYLGYNYYLNTVYNKFGFFPRDLIPDKNLNSEEEFLKIKKLLKPYLNNEIDTILVSDVFGWEFRDKININNINYNEYECPALDRVQNEIFISPDGTWYLCCYDSENYLTIGNILNEKIEKLFFGKKRTSIITNLKNRKFGEINGPCKTVNCCVPLNR